MAWQLCDDTGPVRGELDEHDVKSLLAYNAWEAFQQNRPNMTYAQETGLGQRLDCEISFPETAL